jgi:hypothetical protein
MIHEQSAAGVTDSGGWSLGAGWCVCQGGRRFEGLLATRRAASGPPSRRCPTGPTAPVVAAAFVRLSDDSWQLELREGGENDDLLILNPPSTVGSVIIDSVFSRWLAGPCSKIRPDYDYRTSLICQFLKILVKISENKKNWMKHIEDGGGTVKIGHTDKSVGFLENRHGHFRAVFTEN